jgi:hypothetical protein
MIDGWTINPIWDGPMGIDTGPDGNLYVPIGCIGGPCALVDALKPGREFPFETIGTQQSPNYVGGATTFPNPKL